MLKHNGDWHFSICPDKAEILDYLTLSLLQPSCYCWVFWFVHIFWKLQSVISIISWSQCSFIFTYVSTNSFDFSLLKTCHSENIKAVNIKRNFRNPVTISNGNEMNFGLKIIQWVHHSFYASIIKYTYNTMRINHSPLATLTQHCQIHSHSHSSP